LFQLGKTPAQARQFAVFFRNPAQQFGLFM
jgi:hypothetical protein